MVAGVGAVSSNDDMLMWLVLLVGLITIGSITVLLLGRVRDEEESEKGLKIDDFTLVDHQ